MPLLMIVEIHSYHRLIKDDDDNKRYIMNRIMIIIEYYYKAYHLDVVDDDVGNDGHLLLVLIALMPVNSLVVALIVDVHAVVVDVEDVPQVGHEVTLKNLDDDLVVQVVVVVVHNHLMDVVVDILHNFYSFVPVVVVDEVTFADVDVSLNNMVEYFLLMIQGVDDAVLVVVVVEVQTSYVMEVDHNFHMLMAFVAVVVEGEEVLRLVVHHLILEVY